MTRDELLDLLHDEYNLDIATNKVLAAFDVQAAEIERLKGALEEIAEFPDGYWIGQANLDYELSKRRGIARVALRVVEPGCYKSARGILPWKDGDEPAEDAIRRLRGE